MEENYLIILAKRQLLIITFPVKKLKMSLGALWQGIVDLFMEISTIL